MNKNNVCSFIIRNTNRFKYYIIKQLCKDTNVPRCHTENLSFENIFIPFKGQNFLRAGAFAPTSCLLERVQYICYKLQQII